jgi:hypothetical protein
MLKNYQSIFIYLLILSYILYALIFIGIVNNSPSYLETLNFVLKIYVSLVLLIRFNPLINRPFTEFDKKIVFSSALFLISTTTINEVAINSERIVTYIRNFIN